MNRVFLRKVAISLLLAPLGAFGLSFPDEILVDGPVAFYRLDETVGTVAEDSSGMGQAAAYAGINAPTLGLTGFLVDGNKAIEMSGSGADASYVLTPGVLNPATTSFTLEAVVQTDAIGAHQMVFQQRDVNGTGRTLLRVSATGEVDSFIGGATRRSGISVAAGEPLHLVMVFERTGLSTSNEGEGTVIFYVNGVKGNSIAMNGSNGVEPSDGEFVIGTQKGFNGQYFNGVIDEVVFYDKALTEARIVEHYESIDESSLILSFDASPRGIEAGGSSVLSWDLDEEVTGIAIDQGLGFFDAEAGSVTVSPTETTTYTLTAADGVRMESREVTVEVGTIGPFVLNEVMAGNTGPLEDEDGDESDWIEIKNTGGIVGSLEGWYLTDDAALLTKWEIAGVEVDGGGYGLVFASGKDRSGEEAHANFKLSQGGEYLALVEPDGVTVHHEFSSGFPAQQIGVSWGIDGAGTGYFNEPTPLGENGVSSAGFVSEVVVADVTRGFFEAAFQVNLSTEAVGADIYYTTDASEPTVETGILYAGAIDIGTTTTLRAGAFREGEVPLEVMTQTYIFPEDVLDQVNNPAGYPSVWQPSVTADYAMDNDAKIGTRAEIKEALRSLPTVSLVMEVDDWFNNSTDPAVGGLYANSVIARGTAWERKVSAEFFDFPHAQEIQVNAGMRIFGNASRATSRKKHNMRLVFRSAYGPSRLEFPLFGGDDEDDVVNSYLLRGQNGDSWFHPTASQREESLYIRDQLARSLQESMNQPATKQDHVHLYINGLYWGVFNTIERIEADSMAAAYGGDKEDWDVMKATPPSSVAAEDGTDAAWQALVELSEADLSSAANYEAIQEYLDMESFIDWLLVNFYNGNSDWDHNNWQAGRKRGSDDQFRFFVWDSERTMLSPTVNSVTKNNVSRPTGIHQQLRANADYRLLFGDRTQRHFFNGGALTAAAVEAEFDRWVEELQVPLVAESARWGDAQRAAEPYTVGDEWQTEVDFQKNTYLPGRSATVLTQLRNASLFPAIDAPVFGQFGGEVALGYALEMTATGPEVFYTLDGSDPQDAGGISYSGAVPLGESVIVKARTRSSGEWSALTTAPFYVGTVPVSSGNVVISEVHYHPASDDGGEEFVELMNVGSAAVDLRGSYFGAGIDFVFNEGTNPELWVIPPGGRVVLVGGENDFTVIHGDLGEAVLGQFSGDLDNGGERLALIDGEGALIDEVIYSDDFPWVEAADGDGYSLVRSDLTAASSEASSWRRSVEMNGNPGMDDAVIFIGAGGLDSDGDGLSDLLEFALGSDESDSEDGPGLVSLELIDGVWNYRFPVHVGAQGIHVEIQKSMDLVSWTEAKNLTFVNRSVSDASSDVLTYELGPEGEKIFLRVKVEVE